MNINIPTDTQFNKHYQKRLKCLGLNGFQPKTVDAYSRAIRRIGNRFDFRIENLSSDQLLDYFSELPDSHSRSTVKLDLYGLKFFCDKILNKSWDNIPLVKPPKATGIPDILTIKQLNQLFDATSILSYKIFFFAICSMGLRLGEGANLTVGDINSENMRVHIRDAKGNKDRFAPLPENTLGVLKNFWEVHRHPLFTISGPKKRGKKRPPDRPAAGQNRNPGSHESRCKTDRH